MTAPEVEIFLHENIPLTRAMGVRVARADDHEVRLWAPLAPNVNHLETGFGGSLATLAILAGWVCLRLKVGPPNQIVIRDVQMKFSRPIEGDFEAVCTSPSHREIERFEARLSRRGRAKLELDVTVFEGDQPACSMRATYVASRQLAGESAVVSFQAAPVPVQ